MNCPLCGQEAGDAENCPNCGSPVRPERLEGPETPETSGQRPGIFYENLAVSQDEARQEHQAPKEPRFSGGEFRGLIGSVLLLVLILGLVWWGCGQYIPDAEALRGREGISMDNRTFSIYYQTELQNMESQYSQQKQALPFDSARSLERQYVDLDRGYSWADYFRQQALQKAALTESLIARAQRAGFRPDQGKIDSLEASIAQLPDMAAAAGYVRKDGSGDLNAYLAARYGAAVTEETYIQYLRDSFLAQAYSDALYSAMDFSEEQLKDYYQAHRSDFSDTPMSRLPDADVRHVLYLPENDSQAAKTAALAQAQGDAEWLRTQGDPEGAMEALAREKSADSGSSQNGGLLSDVAPGQLSGAFSSWCFPEQGRQYGDITVVESSYGVHLVMFVRYRENFRWKEQVRSAMRSEQLAQAYAQLLEETDCHLTRFAVSPPTD